MPNTHGSYSAYLTNLAGGFSPPINLAWIHMFPFFPVNRESDKFFRYDPERSVLKRRNLKVGHLDKSPVMDYNWTEDSYVCEERRLKGFYTRRQILNARPPMDPPRDTTEAVLHAIDANLEYEVFEQVSNAMTDLSLNRTVPSNKEWNKYSAGASDPIADVKLWKSEIKTAITDWSNGQWILLLDDDVVDVLLDHPLIVSRTTGSGSTQAPAVVNLNTLAQVLKVDQVIPVNSVINTAVEGNGTPVLVRTWSKKGMLFWRANGIVVKRPTFGYTFRWDGFAIDGITSVNGVVVYENKLNDPPNAFEIIGQRHDAFKMITPQAGRYLTGLIE